MLKELSQNCNLQCFLGCRFFKVVWEYGELVIKIKRIISKLCFRVTDFSDSDGVREGVGLQAKGQKTVELKSSKTAKRNSLTKSSHMRITSLILSHHVHPSPNITSSDIH